MKETDFVRHLLHLVEVHGSQKALAEAKGISETYLSDILNRRKNASAHFATLFFFHQEREYRVFTAQEQDDLRHTEQNTHREEDLETPL